MKIIHKLFDYFKKNKSENPKGKKGANLKYNPTLYFQFSLILSIALVAIVINATFEVTSKTIANPLPEDRFEVWLHDIVIVEPKQEPIVKEKPIKKVNPDRVRVTEKVVTKELVVDTDPEPTVIPNDTPIKIKPLPKPPLVDDKTYSLIGVE